MTGGPWNKGFRSDGTVGGEVYVGVMSSNGTAFVEPAGSDPAEMLAAIRTAVAELATVEVSATDPLELGELLVAAEAIIDALTGTAASWTRTFKEVDGPRAAGSASLASWSRQHLRVTARVARTRVKAARALDALPKTREALESGRIGYAHAVELGAGVSLLSAEVIREFEDILLDVAETCDADAVKRAVWKLRDVLDPDAADQAYVDRLNNRDISVAETNGGFVIRGFVDPETGVMVKQVLYAGAKPASGDDDRTSGQRRVDALREIFRSHLDHGLPTDRGVRPHLFVTISLDQLHQITRAGAYAGLAADAVTGRVGIGLEPATLDGYGPITSTLAARLACDCAITPVIVDRTGPFPNVLDVGRTRRLATLKQREAIRIQQGGRCFNPGCDSTHLEIHHLIRWSLGGNTDLNGLRGYCTRCHHLIHAGMLAVKRDEAGDWRHYDFRTREIVDHRRRVETATDGYLARLAAERRAERCTAGRRPGIEKQLTHYLTDLHPREPRATCADLHTRAISHLAASHRIRRHVRIYYQPKQDPDPP